ncbi:MAG: STAS/SEC14 domain-containing protein [Syntrophobacteraceae bacterium]
MNAASQQKAGNVVVFRIHDQMTSEEIEQNGRRLELSLAPDLPTHLLVEIDGFRHMQPERLTDTLRFLGPFASVLSRVAVIGGRTWIKSWIKVGAFPFATTVEYFDSTESDRAWHWVNAWEGAAAVPPSPGFSS